MSEQIDDRPLWQITDMPQQHGSGCDYVAWLRRKDGLNVKVHVPEMAGEENAFLIVQQFAGILTPFGLEQMMKPVKATNG